MPIKLATVDLKTARILTEIENNSPLPIYYANNEIKKAFHRRLVEIGKKGPNPQHLTRLENEIVEEYAKHNNQQYFRIATPEHFDFKFIKKIIQKEKQEYIKEKMDALNVTTTNKYHPFDLVLYDKSYYTPIKVSHLIMDKIESNKKAFESYKAVSRGRTHTDYYIEQKIQKFPKETFIGTPIIFENKVYLGLFELIPGTSTEFAQYQHDLEFILKQKLTSRHVSWFNSSNNNELSFALWTFSPSKDKRNRLTINNSHYTYFKVKKINNGCLLTQIDSIETTVKNPCFDKIKNLLKGVNIHITKEKIAMLFKPASQHGDGPSLVETVFLDLLPNEIHSSIHSTDLSELAIESEQGKNRVELTKEQFIRYQHALMLLDKKTTLISEQDLKLVRGSHFSLPTRAEVESQQETEQYGGLSKAALITGNTLGATGLTVGCGLITYGIISLPISPPLAIPLIVAGSILVMASLITMLTVNLHYRPTTIHKVGYFAKQDNENSATHDEENSVNKQATATTGEERLPQPVMA